MKLRRDLTAIALGLSTVAAFAQTGTTETRQIKEEGKTIGSCRYRVELVIP